MRTSMIIPCYFLDESYIDMTDRCLDSMGREEPDEVIIVDDGSPMHAEFANTEYIRLDENSGFTKAVNTGLENATGDILIICNNDIIFYPGWLKGLTDTLKTHDISHICVSDQSWETKDEITENDKFGSLWAMKRETYEKLGELDEQFKSYFSDLDYWRRAQNAGLKIGKNHNYIVEHKGKHTYKVVDPKDKGYNEAKELYIKKWGFLE